MNRFASRPVHTASAVRVSFLGLGVIASLAIGKALLAQGLATPAMAEPAAGAAATAQSGAEICRQIVVEIDEADGLTGRAIRFCRKAL